MASAIWRPAGGGTGPTGRRQMPAGSPASRMACFMVLGNVCSPTVAWSALANACSRSASACRPARKAAYKSTNRRGAMLAQAVTEPAQPPRSASRIVASEAANTASGRAGKQAA